MVEYNNLAPLPDLDLVKIFPNNIARRSVPEQYRTRTKALVDKNYLLDKLETHPVLKNVFGEAKCTNVCVAGGFLSRLACDEDPYRGDIDLFMYGDYTIEHVGAVCDTINDLFDNINWYRYGSVIAMQAPIIIDDFITVINVQIICSDRKDPQDVIESFDASYVQIAYDGQNIIVTDDFNNYTPFALAKIVRPSYSNLRLTKMQDRGFLPVVRNDQYVFSVERSVHNVSEMEPISLVKAITTVYMKGSFNPYLELDYNYKRDLTMSKEKITIKVEPCEFATWSIVVYSGDEKLRSFNAYDEEWWDMQIRYMKDDTLLDPRVLDGQEVNAYVFRNSDNLIVEVRIMA